MTVHALPTEENWHTIKEVVLCERNALKVSCKKNITDSSMTGSKCFEFYTEFQDE